MFAVISLEFFVDPTSASQGVHQPSQYGPPGGFLLFKPPSTTRANKRQKTCAWFMIHLSSRVKETKLCGAQAPKPD